MVEKLKPPFEQEFPDPGLGWSEDAERLYESGQINAAQAAGTSAVKHATTYEETEAAHIDMRSSRSTTSHGRTKDGSIDRRTLSPRAQLLADEAPAHIRHDPYK